MPNETSYKYWICHYLSIAGHQPFNHNGSQYKPVVFEYYSSPEIAYAHAQGQLAYYRILESQGKLRIIKNWETLDAHIEAWGQAESVDGAENIAESLSLGVISSMEGADSIISPDHVQLWWDDGLRILGLSHYSVSNYAHGTGTSGGLTLLERPLTQSNVRIWDDS